MKIIILNGPPQSGKDEARETLEYAGYHFLHIKFAQPIRDSLCAGLGIEDDEVEDYKQQDPAFRPAMIDISENVFKKHYGQDFFANRAANRVKEYADSLKAIEHAKVLVTDGGFGYEVDHFIKSTRARLGKPAAAVQIWQIHRPGHTFRGDSREWVRNKAVHNLQIHNSAELETFRCAILANAELFWGTP